MHIYKDVRRPPAPKDRSEQRAEGEDKHGNKPGINPTKEADKAREFRIPAHAVVEADFDGDGVLDSVAVGASAGAAVHVSLSSRADGVRLHLRERPLHCHHPLRRDRHRPVELIDRFKGGTIVVRPGTPATPQPGVGAGDPPSSGVARRR